jgi:hypothetical protein
VALIGNASRQVGASQAAATSDPTVLTLIATLLDPQGNPMRNQLITFFAEFSDATFIPEGVPTGTPLACRDPLTGSGTDCSNRGAAITDDNGQARILLIAGLTLGRMRVIAEAHPSLNISTGISVDITSQGFVSLGDLDIIPEEVTFINPLVDPDIPQECPDTPEENPNAIFNAVGGTPPYRWDNSNKDLGRICPTGLPNVNQTAAYTLIGPIPAEETGALEDTVRLLDADGNQATAEVTVIFADCQLRADGTQVTLTGVPGNNFLVDVSDGVPPFAITQQFPGSVNVVVNVIDENGNIIPGEVCDTAGERCVITLSLPTTIRVVDPGSIFIRDTRGCTADIQLTVELCGNGIVDAGEQCDGSIFDAAFATCEDITGPGSTGSPFCNDDCTVDSSNCQAPPAEE